MLTLHQTLFSVTTEEHCWLGGVSGPDTLGANVDLNLHVHHAVLVARTQHIFVLPQLSSNLRFTLNIVHHLILKQSHEVNVTTITKMGKREVK